MLFLLAKGTSSNREKGKRYADNAAKIILYEPVLRILDVYPESEFFPSQIPDQKDFRIRNHMKEFKFFNPKNYF
jgi:hypothetical protein